MKACFQIAECSLSSAKMPKKSLIQKIILIFWIIFQKIMLFFWIIFQKIMLFFWNRAYTPPIIVAYRPLRFPHEMCGGNGWHYVSRISDPENAVALPMLVARRPVFHADARYGHLVLSHGELVGIALAGFESRSSVSEQVASASRAERPAMRLNVFMVFIVLSFTLFSICFLLLSVLAIARAPLRGRERCRLHLVASGCQLERVGLARL